MQASQGVPGKLGHTLLGLLGLVLLAGGGALFSTTWSQLAVLPVSAGIVLLLLANALHRTGSVRPRRPRGLPGPVALAPEDAEPAGPRGNLAQLYGGARPEPGERVGLFHPHRHYLLKSMNQPSYLVFSHGLVVDMGSARLTVAWADVRTVWHHPEVHESYGSWGRTYHDYCVLGLTGTADRLIIHGARHQAELSDMIVEATRDQIVRRLISRFEQDGAVRLGELTLDHEGVHHHSGAQLPWRADWKIIRRADRTGTVLVIRTPDGERLIATVPEKTVATAVLTKLACPLTKAPLTPPLGTEPGAL